MQNVWHLSWNHLVAKNSQKRFAYVIVNNSLWQLLFIWKVAEKTHWNITLSYLSLTIFMLAALILMNVHLRHCYILKSKICDTNHEITRLLITNKKLYEIVNNSLWQLFFIWKVAKKTHWNLTSHFLPVPDHLHASHLDLDGRSLQILLKSQVQNMWHLSWNQLVAEKSQKR